MATSWDDIMEESQLRRASDADSIGSRLNDAPLPMIRRTSATDSEGSQTATEGIELNGVRYESEEAAMAALSQMIDRKKKLAQESEMKKKKEEYIAMASSIEADVAEILTTFTNYKKELDNYKFDESNTKLVTDVKAAIDKILKKMPKTTLKPIATPRTPNTYAARLTANIRVPDIETDSISSDGAETSVTSGHTYKLPTVKINRPTDKIPFYSVPDEVVKGYKEHLIEQLSKAADIKEDFTIYKNPLTEKDMEEIGIIDPIPEYVLEDTIKPIIREVFSGLFKATIKVIGKLNINGYVLFPYLLRSENNFIMFEEVGSDRKFRVHLDWAFYDYKIREKVFSTNDTHSMKVKIINSSHRYSEFRPSTETFKKIVSKMDAKNTVMDENYDGCNLTIGGYYGHVCGFHIQSHS